MKIKPPCPVCSGVVPSQKHKYCSSLCGYTAKAIKERERIKRIGRGKSYYVKKGHGSRRDSVFSNEYLVVKDGKVKNIPIANCSCGGKYLTVGATRGCCGIINN